MHRSTTRRDILLVLTVLALFILASSAALALDKSPSLKASSPKPTKTLSAFYSKPTLPEQAEEVKLDIPLSDKLVSVLVEACEAERVPVSLALGVMEQESNFKPDAVSPSGCYGLMQLNPAYFPSDLSSAENIRAGIKFLGELLETHDTTEAAVTAYFYGPSSRTSSWYSDEVLERVKHWREVAATNANFNS